jgi:DNA polymerase-3 subunit beta
MHFVCSQAELATALAVVGRAAPTRPSQPILATVLIEGVAASGHIRLTGFDLHLGIQTDVAATINTPGKTAVSLKLLSDIVSHLPKDGPLTVDTQGKQIILKTTCGEYKINCQDPEDYPDLPSVDAQGIAFPHAVMLQALKGVLYAVSIDESKQLLTGMCFTIGKQIEAAATDGHRLSILTVPSSDSESDHEDIRVVIPGKALRELGVLLKEQPEDIRFAYAKGQAVFQVGSQVLTTRLLDGTFPEYRKLLPASFKTHATVNRTALIAALNRVAVLANQHNNVVKTALTGDRAEIAAEAQDVGSGSETIAMTLEGDEITMAFNVAYLLDALKAFGSESVVLSCNAPTTPVILRPINDVGERTSLIMPVQIRV